MLHQLANILLCFVSHKSHFVDILGLGGCSGPQHLPNLFVGDMRDAAVFASSQFQLVGVGKQTDIPV